MPTLDTEDRREYYRIEDRVALEILSEPPGAADRGRQALFEVLGELHQLDFEAQHLLRQIAENDRPLANYLKVQNRRIELLGQAMARDLLGELGEQAVVLSEGGISFDCDHALPQGQRLRLKLVLLPQGLGLLLAARVVRCAAQAQGGYEIGTEFEALTDAQRQLLARHILQKQAQQRRLARNHLQGE